MNPKTGEELSLHKKTLKLDWDNAKAMINGFRVNGDETIYKQAIYIISDKRKILWNEHGKDVDNICLITFNQGVDELLIKHLNANTQILNEPYKIPEESIRNRNERKYKYIAVCDTIYKTKNNAEYDAICVTICDNTLFNIWNPSGPQTRIAYGIGLFRIYKINEEFNNQEIETKGIAPSEIKEGLNKKVTICEPVLTDPEFKKIKELLEISISESINGIPIHDTLRGYVGTSDKDKSIETNKIHKDSQINELTKPDITKFEKELTTLCNLLKFKKQIILQGAPGTGKTYTAEEIAKKLTENNRGEYKIIQFHPAYTYEDFVRGIVAKTTKSGISYEVEDKILLEFVEKAKDESKNFVLILDEINRANLPAVLGELIFALEYRNKIVDCLYKKGISNSIKLPDNLYLIGTMNTSDRSVGNIDYAIRRRFAFYLLKADKEIIRGMYKNTYKLAVELFEEVEELFSNISPDFNKEDVMIGHSYFLSDDLHKLKLKLEYEIKPILREYIKDGVLLDNNDLLKKINALKL
jgi:Cdc6-like AAA superfamily ATPase